MDHRHPDAGQMSEARRDLMRSLATLTAPAMLYPSQAARNVTYHAEVLMRCLDAFYADREPDEDRRPL